METVARRMTSTQRSRVDEFVTRLFGSHDGQLRRYLQRMLGSKQAAEEVAQETYTKLFRLCRPDEVKCPRALLFDTATKQAIDYLHAERSRTAVLASGVGMDEVSDQSAHPERDAAAAQAMLHLRKVIENLQPKYRVVFVLRFIHQMSHREIAQRLNISPDAAQQRAAAALAECRSRLQALGVDPPALD